jgi:putative redox protein
MLPDDRHVVTPHAAAAPLGADGGIHGGRRGLTASAATERGVVQGRDAVISAVPRPFYGANQTMPEQRRKRLFAKDITGTIAANRQQVDVQWRAGTLVIDEPTFNGGQDKGPDPFTLILAGLVGCTLTTLRMYVRRKGWSIDDIRVDANMVQQREPFRTTIWRTVAVGQAITEEQRAKLLHIAVNCPVARLLEGEIVIQTELDVESSSHG